MSRFEKQAGSTETLTLGEQLKTFRRIIACGFLLLVMIGLTAFSSKLQYDINTLQKQIVEEERAVQNLQVEIKSASGVAEIESKALKLGMIYPNFENMIYLEETEDDLGDFALALLEYAYE